MQSSIHKSLLAYVMPFVVFMAGLMLVDGLKNPEATSLWLKNPELWIYPIQTALCAGVLLYYWPQYDFGKREGWAFAILAGAVVLGLWIAPQILFGVNRRDHGFDPTLIGEGHFIYHLTVLARFARLVIIVPLVEEIFWRGFLMRFLIREEFTSLPIGAFQWRSFAVVTVCFMLVHSSADWPAAFLCGVIYNTLAVQTGSLGACVLAHAVTNLGLGVYIMTTKQWGFW